jgi:hypothetical protein
MEEVKANEADSFDREIRKIDQQQVQLEKPSIEANDRPLISDREHYEEGGKKIEESLSI